MDIFRPYSSRDHFRPYSSFDFLALVQFMFFGLIQVSRARSDFEEQGWSVDPFINYGAEEELAPIFEECSFSLIVDNSQVNIQNLNSFIYTKIYFQK